MSNTQSTTDKGNDFRDAVAAILRTKYSDTQTEVRIEHKKVDIVFTKQDFGRRVKFAVECKDYARPLTKEYIKTEIYADYEPLIGAGSIDRLLIIAPKDISADARSYINAIKWASFQTHNQLEEELLGLRDYISGLADLFNDRQLDRYYVEARLHGINGNAFDYIKNWLISAEVSPLAILGGYGKGKTSLASRIISHQAKCYLEDPTQRMPVLIRLGQVVHETQLEALFGKEFTARHPAQDFRYKTLEHLNELGRLLIVLDGFDEMKHAMSASDFRSNFKEFNRLLKPKAKVLLLGRPNAVPTEARDHVFRGQRTYRGLVTNDPNFQRWEEVEIDFFDDEEINQFLHNYLAYLLEGRADVKTEEFIVNRVKEIREEVAFDLLRRPVHAKIVAELAADPNFDLSGFTQHTLYSQFITRLIERDVEEKQARNAIDVDARLEFQYELAWWAWTKGGEGQGFFSRDEVPIKILSNLPNGRATSDETKLSEYLVSTLTEEKETGILYFAHRSFQEFLIAERVRQTTPSADQHALFAKYLTPDIHVFLNAAPNNEHIARWHETLGSCNIALPINYFRYFKNHSTLVRNIFDSTSAENVCFSDVCIIGLPALDDKNEIIERDELISYLGEILSLGEPNSSAMAFACLTRIWHETDSTKAGNAILVGLMVRLALNMKPNDRGEHVILIPSAKYGILEKACASCIKKESSTKTGITIQLDVMQSFEMVAQYLLVESKLFSPEEGRVALDSWIGQEFFTHCYQKLNLKPITLSLNNITSSVRDKNLKADITAILRPHGSRMPVVELEEKRKRALDQPRRRLLDIK